MFDDLTYRRWTHDRAAWIAAGLSTVAAEDLADLALVIRGLS